MARSVTKNILYKENSMDCLSLREIAEKVKKCRKCSIWVNGKAVPGEGPADAKLMVVGQNPGREEAVSGRPFVGRSGKFLSKVLASNGLDRKDIFITSIVKHNTPGNRPPNICEIENCKPYLAEQMKALKPKVVLLMGKTAHKSERFKSIKYVETCHPAAAMRFPKMRQKFENDIAKVARLLRD